MNLIKVSPFPADPSVNIFQLQDRITLDNFPELEAITRTAYSQGARKVVLDLGLIASLSSIGVRGIVVIHKILSTGTGSPLKIAGASSQVQNVLQISGITQFIPLYDTVEEAAAAFRNPD